MAEFFELFPTKRVTRGRACVENQEDTRVIRKYDPATLEINQVAIDDKPYVAVLGTKDDFDNWKAFALSQAARQGDYVSEDAMGVLTIGGKGYLQVDKWECMCKYHITGWAEARSDIPMHDDLLSEQCKMLLYYYHPELFNN